MFCNETVFFFGGGGVLSPFEVFISFIRLVNIPKTDECIAASQHNQISVKFVGLA